ncbi:hypothetical protein B0T22DRAFT_536089 [Podospora appendiculata]|uniref:Rhodopsin domain-containing protein n=1 Tax=Podospora appendiculata TaxID=314037 RepID=A0AAE0XAH6_9PEZI|nr:hypothetical protein B0T22DRAFT_536089 [Podospora appendiculata]
MVRDISPEGERGFVAIVVCNTIAWVAVALRFWCKMSSKAGVHADDWWILLCLAGGSSASAVSLWGLFAGSGGKEMPEIIGDLISSPSLQKVQDLENYLESLWLGFFLAFVALWAVKISVCLLYRRIFAIPQFRLTCLVLMGISTAWFIAAVITMLLICTPLDGFWHRLQPATCKPNFNLFSLIMGIIEVFLDAAIMVVPIRAILSLKLRTRAKVFVLGIFLLAGFALITNCLRLYYQYQPNTEFIQFHNTLFWLEIHCTTALVCACLPAYGPLGSKLGLALSRMRDRYGGFSVRSLLGGGGSRSGSSRWRTTTMDKGSGSDDTNSTAPAAGNVKSVVSPYYQKRGFNVSVMQSAGHSPAGHLKGLESTSDLILTPHDAGGVHVAAARSSEGSDTYHAIPLRGISRTTRVEVV